NHAVAAIEQQHGRARALIFALMDHQILIINVERDHRAAGGLLASKRVKQSFGNIQIQRVAEFVWLRRAARFDSGGEIARVVAAETAFPERGQQIAQSFESQEVDRFVGDFKSRIDVLLSWRADLTAGRLLWRRSDLRRLGRKIALFESAQNGLAKLLHRTLGVHFLEAVVLRLEAALQQKIRKAVHQFLQI